MAEPTSADVQAVQAAIAPATPTPTPTPAATPAPSQPAPTATPTPAPADPFASIFAQEPATTPKPTPPAPTTPTEPQPNPQPVQPPTEPVQPVQPLVPNMTPVEPGATPAPATPAAPATPPPVAPAKPEQYQSYEDYMKTALEGVPTAPEAPDPSTVPQDDPEKIKEFFTGLMNTAEKRFEAKFERKNAIQTAEKKAWDEAFGKYETLKTNKNVRDMVHNIRMGYFSKGVAITPTQAAEKLLSSINTSYKQGIADNQVTTTIEQVQPTGGGATPPATPGVDKNTMLTQLQTGGEQALMGMLDNEIKNGRL